MTPEVAESILAAARMSDATKAKMLALVKAGDPHATFTLRGIGLRLGLVERSPQAADLSRRWFGEAARG